MKDLELPREHRKPHAVYSLSKDEKRIMVSYDGAFGLVTERGRFPFDTGALKQSDRLYELNATLELGSTMIRLSERRIANGADLIAVFEDGSMINAKYLSFFPANAIFSRNGGTVFVYDNGEWCGVVMCMRSTPTN